MILKCTPGKKVFMDIKIHLCINYFVCSGFSLIVSYGNFVNSHESLIYLGLTHVICWPHAANLQFECCKRIFSYFMVNKVLLQTWLCFDVPLQSSRSSSSSSIFCCHTFWVEYSWTIPAKKTNVAQGRLTSAVSQFHKMGEIAIQTVHLPKYKPNDFMIFRNKCNS